MNFGFIEDPQWQILDKDTQDRVLNLAFDKKYTSDPQWGGLSPDDQSSVRGLFIEKARNYEKSLLPEPPGFLGGLKHFVGRAGSVLTDVVPETIGRTIRGGDTSLKKSFLDEWIETNEREKEESKELSPDVRKQTWVNTPFGPITYAHLEDAPDSLGYSIANAFAAGGGAKAGGATGLAVSGGNPIVGAAGALIGAFLGGTAVSGRATKDQFLGDMQKKFLESVGGQVNEQTEQRWQEIREELNSDANWYGFWEAAPETVGNMLTFGIFKYGGKLTKPLFSKIKNNIAAKVGANAAKMAGVLSEEELTEALTTMKQSGIEAGHGLRERPLSYAESAKEVWPTVALTTPLLGGGGAIAARLTQGQQQQLPEKTPSQKISDVINVGMATGEVNGQSFTPDHAINFIKQGYIKNIFSDADISQFKERYPELVEGLREDISLVADIGKAASVDEAVASFEKATSGDEELSRVYGEARKRVGLLTPLAMAEKEFEAYGGPELPWQTMKEGEGVEVMARPRGLLQPKTAPNIFELQKRIRQRHRQIVEAEKEYEGYIGPELPSKPEVRMKEGPRTYPRSAGYVAGKPAPESLEVEHKPILTQRGQPWVTQGGAQTALKSQKRLQEKGITVKTHKVVPFKGGFAIEKKVAETAEDLKKTMEVFRKADKSVRERLGDEVPPVSDVFKKAQAGAKTEKSKTLLSFVRAMGGIKDATLPGEVRALTAKETGVVGLTTKRTDKGLGFDEMALAAVEEGWIAKPEDFSETLRDDIFAQKEKRPRAKRLTEIAEETEREERWKEFERAEDEELEYFAKHPDEVVGSDLDQWQREAVEEIRSRNDARAAREIEESVESEGKIEAKKETPGLVESEKDEGWAEFSEAWDENDALDEETLAELDAWRAGKEKPVELVEKGIISKTVVPIWEEGRKPSDRDILSARKIVQAEKTERKKTIKETGFPQGRFYGLIEKKADTLTTKEEKLKAASEKVKAETPGMLKESDKVNDVTLGTLVDHATKDPATALEHAADATVSKAKLIEGLKNKGLKAMGEAKSKEERAEIKKNLEETLRGIEGKKPKEPIAEVPKKPKLEVAPKPKIAEPISALLSSKKKAGINYEMEVTIEETGETVTVTKDAAVALRETKKELSRYEKFLACLT